MQRGTTTSLTGNTSALAPNDRLARFEFQIATVTDGAIAWGRRTGASAAAVASGSGGAAQEQLSPQSCGDVRRAGRDLGDPLELRPGQEWASAEQLARRFDMSLKWIHKHRAELGGRRISPDVANSKWKFHVPTADTWMRAGMAQPRRPVKRGARAVAELAAAGSPRRDFRR